MKRISRREFNRLAVAGAAAAPLAGTALRAAAARTSPSKPAAALTTDQEKKLKQALAKRDGDMKEMRGRTLAYGLEPAFIFRVRGSSRRSQARA